LGVKILTERIDAMNVAFLFNSDHHLLGSYYGYPIMKAILETGILQSVDRSMRISVGDILTYSNAMQYNLDHAELCQRVYQPVSLDHLYAKKLKDTFNTATIYCLLFQNMDLLTAQKIHSSLNSFPPYLGSMDIKFSNPLHLYFFRNSLIELYRLDSGRISLFYSMGEMEEGSFDTEIKDLFETFGFLTTFEDIGARGTIFDNFDNIEHFKRIESFENFFMTLAGLETEDISNAIYNLEELHPKLFDILAASARTLERAETEEDLAQAALSGRRFLEKLAHYLFPPQNELWRGRKVGTSEYKNRIWAYITMACEKSHSDSIKKLGKEADRLIELFNAGLHATPSKEKIETAFCDLIKWIEDVIQINPSEIRKPYLAYEQEMHNFLDGSLKTDV
jgi:hypothetical protein